MRRAMTLVTVLVLLGLMSASEASGITRIAIRLNTLELYGGGGSVTGDYNGFPSIPFVINNRRVDVSADDIYDAGYHFGFSYGQLRNRHFLVSIGGRITDHAAKNIVPLPLDSALILASGFNMTQYDLTLDLNYLFFDLRYKPWTPYFGLGVQAGIISLSWDDYATENEANVALSLNFGGDIKLWAKGRDGRSIVTLSSVNSWNFAASSDRPQYLQFGLGVKYWFRP